MSDSLFSILGSGASSSTPWLQCLIGSNCCAVCDDCRRNPSTSKNIRNNVSALLTVPSRTSAYGVGDPHHVMIDAGKTMRQTVMKWFPAFGVQALAAVVLTHPHADAFLGLDDLRDLSPRRVLPVYLSRRCFDVVQKVFSYLVPEGSVARRNEKFGYGLYDSEEDELNKGGAAAMCAPATTFVAMIEWRIFQEWEPFVIPEANNVIVTPVPVQHGAGRGNISFAFEFGLRLGDEEEDDEKEDMEIDNIKAEKEEEEVDEGKRKKLKSIHDEKDLENNTKSVITQHHNVIELLSSLDVKVDEKDKDSSSTTTSSTTTRDEVQQLSAEPGVFIDPHQCHPAMLNTSTMPTLPSFKGSRILYISDVSSISPTARQYLRSRQTDLLFLDLLNYARYSTHFNAQQAVNCAADIRASKVRFVGINHGMDHDVENDHMRSIGERIKEGRLDIGLARDGLRFSFSLASISSVTGLENLKREISSVREACLVQGKEEDDPEQLIDYYKPVLEELLPDNSPTKIKFGKR
jgi:phosphoribosyl 1,2-cyclic phosphodiesterase